MMIRPLFSRFIPISQLRLVRPAPPQDDPPLGIGDWCVLNSGGPRMLVVDVEWDRVTVGLEDGTEHEFWRACVRRCL